MYLMIYEKVYAIEWGIRQDYNSNGKLTYLPWAAMKSL